MKNKKVKIGDVEFELPFEANGDEVFDTGETFVCDADSAVHGNYNDMQIAETIALALNNHFSRQWVSVKDGLPEESDYYWVTVEHLESGKRIVVEEYFYGGFETEVGFEILAWREKPKKELPEPYEGNDG